MSAAKTAIDVLLALLQASPAFAELIESLTGQSKATIVERLKRARVAIKDPIDTAPADATRRAELERILRGDG